MSNFQLRQHSTARRWRKMKKQNTAAAEEILRSKEPFCINACSKFINRNSLNAQVWTLGDSGGISSLIIHVRQSLLPVFNKRNNIPVLHFLRGLFGTIPIRSIQGNVNDTEILETTLEKIGLFTVEKVNCDLMCLNRVPSGYHSAGPAGLVIRKPEPCDMSALAALHAAYEQEEVLPKGSVFNPAVSRLNSEKLFKNEQMLVAELGGRLIGKINTNAVSFSRIQIGGVYVQPEYRGNGIARRMAGEFAASLFAQGSQKQNFRGISLFVKKSNKSACSVYRNIGFEVSGNYRICYY